MGARLTSDAGSQKNFAFDLRHKNFVYDQADSNSPTMSIAPPAHLAIIWGPLRLSSMAMF